MPKSNRMTWNYIDFWSKLVATPKSHSWFRAWPGHNWHCQVRRGRSFAAKRQGLNGWRTDEGWQKVGWKHGTSDTGTIAGWWFGCHFWHVPINIGVLIIPIDELIFFRGVAKPPTSTFFVISSSARKLIGSSKEPQYLMRNAYAECQAWIFINIIRRYSWINKHN